MATLPTLTVSDDQVNYLLTVFGSADGYKAWLLAQIKAKIVETEMVKARADAQAYIEQQRAAIEARLAGIT